MSESGLNMSGHICEWAGWEYGLVKPVHKNFKTLIR